MLINQEGSTVISVLWCACRSVAVRMEDYEVYYRKQKADSNCGFAEEFEVEPRLQHQLAIFNQHLTFAVFYFFLSSCFLCNFQRTWSLLVQISQKPLPQSWRTSPRTATTTCSPVSYASFLQLLGSSTCSFIACHAVSHRFHYISLLCRLRWFFESETLNYPRQSIWWLHQC